MDAPPSFCWQPVAVALVISSSRGNRLLFYHQGSPSGQCEQGTTLKAYVLLKVHAYVHGGQEHEPSLPRISYSAWAARGEEWVWTVMEDIKIYQYAMLCIPYSIF